MKQNMHLTEITNLICSMDGLSVIMDLLLPIAVAISAIVTAWYTRKLIIETKMMRLSQYEPNIGIYVDDNYELEHYRNIIIKNYGPGAAYLVKFEILKDYDTLIKRKISEYQIFKNGLRYFAPNLEYSIPIIISSEDAPFELIIKITYYNCLNIEKFEIFNCPIISYDKFEKQYTHPNMEICNMLSEIQCSINSLDNTIEKKLSRLER